MNIYMILFWIYVGYCYIDEFISGVMAIVLLAYRIRHMCNEKEYLKILGVVTAMRLVSFALAPIALPIQMIVQFSSKKRRNNLVEFIEDFDYILNDDDEEVIDAEYCEKKDYEA